MIGDESATHRARSGGGPGEGFLVDTRRGKRGWIGGKCQRPEALPDHLALRDDHRLAVEQVAGRWQARVIFDL